MKLTKKQFAMILTAQENCRRIDQILSDVIGARGGVTRAYSACKEIQAINAKFDKDFGKVDPRWTPDSARDFVRPTAKKVELPAQEEVMYFACGDDDHIS